MSVFMAFALGALVGAVLGGIGMLLFIKETRLDLALMDADSNVAHYEEFMTPSVHCKAAPAPELDWNDLELPKEDIKYGEF